MNVQHDRKGLLQTGHANQDEQATIEAEEVRTSARLLAMPDAAAHFSLLAADFPATLARFLDAHALPHSHKC